MPPAGRSSVVPDALSWRDQLDGSRAPKGPAAWTAASTTTSDRTLIDAGPYGVIDLATDSIADANQHLGVVWWDKRSFREEDDDFGTIQTSFVPAPLTDHVSLAGPSRPAQAPVPAPAPAAPHPVDAAMLLPADAVGTVELDPNAQPRHAKDHEVVWLPVAATAPSTAPSPGAPAVAQPSLEAAPPVAETPSRAALTTEAPPISANRPVEEDAPEHSRRALRSRHVALVPRARGRRGKLPTASHPRRARLRRRRTRRRVVLAVVLVVIAFVTTVLIQSAIVTPFTVPSVSMENTLHSSDRILVNRLAYGSSPVHRGDVVVFKDPGGWLDRSQPTTQAGTGDFLVKRVIGIPGDRVSCCTASGRVKVNGTELLEKYIAVAAGQPAAPEFDVTVPAGALWVLGDNRFNSRDSSQTQELATKGFVPIADVIGQAVVKLWPLTQLTPIGTARETFASVPDQTCVI